MAIKILPGDVIYGMKGTPRIIVRQPSDPTDVYHSWGTADGEANFFWYEADASPDLSEIAFGVSTTPFIRRFNLADGTLFPPPGNLPPAACEAIAYRPDGTTIAVAHNSSPFVTRYNRADMTKLTDFAVSPGSHAHAVRYSPDGSILAVGHELTPFISLYDVATGTKLANPATLPVAGVDNIGFSPDGAYLYCFSGGTGVQYVYRTSDWTAISLGSQTSATKNGRFSPDGTKLAMSGSSSAYLRIWDIAAGVFTPRTVAAAPEASPGGGMRWLDDDTIIFQTDTRWYKYTLSTNAWTYAYPGLYPSGSAPGLGCFIFPGGAKRKFAGTVKDGSGNPLVRDVVAYDRASGRTIGKTKSSAVDGTFVMEVWSNLPAVIYAVGEGAEVTELFDAVIPVAY